MASATFDAHLSPKNRLALAAHSRTDASTWKYAVSAALQHLDDPYFSRDPFWSAKIALDGSWTIKALRVHRRDKAPLDRRELRRHLEELRASDRLEPLAGGQIATTLEFGEAEAVVVFELILRM